MYRRYEPTGNPSQQAQPKHTAQSAGTQRQPQTQKQGRGAPPRGQQPKPQSKPPAKQPSSEAKQHPITGFIPRSVYNPDTGKIFGIMSAEDLLIAALILLLIDSGDDSADNSMLIYALIYILISGHTDLPF